MFGLFDLSSFWGIGMIILQVLRGLTIIGLGSGIAASVILIAKVDIGRDYWFFDAVSSSFTVLFAIFLIVTELPVLKGWLRNNWPSFSTTHGLGWLGLAIIIIGCNILGKLTQPYAARKEIGGAMWQLVLAGGILNIVFGGLNIVATFVFMDRKNGINARDIRAHGSLAESQKDYSSSLPAPGSFAGSRASSIRKEKGRSKFASMFWKKNDDGGKEFARPQISGPMPTHRDIERDADIDNDKPRSPIDPTVRRPDSTYHPIHNVRASSRYSEANMSRF